MAPPPTKKKAAPAAAAAAGASSKKPRLASPTSSPTALAATKKTGGAVAARPDAAAVDDKVASRVNEAQALRAAQALLKHHAKFQAEKAAKTAGGKTKKKSLFDADGEAEGEDFVYVQVALSKIPERVSPKPVPIKLPTPIYRADDDHAICVIVKEEDKGKVQRALAGLKIEGCSEVVGLQELRTDYKQFQERRKLRDAFDLFLVDDRILPMLGKALGKIFFSKKKQPVPLKLGGILSKGANGDPATVGKRILAARNRTYLYRNHGNCVSLRVARTTMGAEQVVANALSALSQAIEALPGKWRNVMAVSLKTSHSAALPIYQRLPQYLVKKPAALAGDPLLLASMKETETETETEKEEGKEGKAPVVAKAERKTGPRKAMGATEEKKREGVSGSGSGSTSKKRPLSAEEKEKPAAGTGKAAAAKKGRKA